MFARRSARYLVYVCVRARACWSVSSQTNAVPIRSIVILVTRVTQLFLYPSVRPFSLVRFVRVRRDFSSFARTQNIENIFDRFYSGERLRVN